MSSYDYQLYSRSTSHKYAKVDKRGGKQQFDSGFGEMLSGTFDSGPPRPMLMVQNSLDEDVENGDSGISLADGEKDCVHTLNHNQTVVTMPPLTKTPVSTDIDRLQRDVSKTVISSDEPPIKFKKNSPRIPKKTVSGSPFAQSGRTLSPPQRSPSPKEMDSTHSSNMGPRSMPVFWNTTGPLTCNNTFHSLNLDRVPPVSFDTYELRQYMGFFLPDKEGDTGFHLAVIHNQPDLLDKLLFIMSRDKNLQPVINEQNALYQTALHLATHTQHLEMMRKLLIAGASINIIDHKGNTPLHITAKFSSTRPLEEITRYISIQTILEVAQVRNNEGQSCIHVAAKNGNTEILRKLRNLGVDIDMQDFNSGKTALHLAVENGSLLDVQFLLETCKADINCLTYAGCSPLHIAAGRGDISIVAYLISMGADPELLTDEGDSALDLAGSDQVIAFLAKVNALKWLY